MRGGDIEGWRTREDGGGGRGWMDPVRVEMLH